MVAPQHATSGIAAAGVTPILGLVAGVPEDTPVARPPVDYENKWWFQARYGMFVHWGLYTIHGWHEQEQWRCRVPREEYVKLQQQWNPVNFNPDHWIDLAEAAGMKYLCFTTKHHEGFCLWDTKLTDYNTMNMRSAMNLLGSVMAIGSSTRVAWENCLAWFFKDGEMTCENHVCAPWPREALS
jgi:hypothetical protein